MELLHQSGEIIALKYRIIDILGQGSSGTTYKAENLLSGEKVAIKALSLHEVTDWKMLELFEREVKILSQLNHPGIPRYLEYFQVDTESDRYFYIVQQLAEGKSLAAWVESGWRTDEAGVRQIASQILEVLVYLHSQKPPVIHRDIKPQNLIRREDGQIFLVDFGAVSNTYYSTLVRGSTVVGTFGYMAPEQFRGQAVLSTDLYGLGTTILFLLTGKSPADLPSRKLKINFRSQVQVSDRFVNWLEKMLSPVIEDRFPSAAAALAVLQGQEPLSNYANQKIDKPENSKITLTKTDEKLIVKIPSKGLHDDRNQSIAILLLVWNCLLFYPWIYTVFFNYFLLIFVLLPNILIGIWFRTSPQISFTRSAAFWNILNLLIFGFGFSTHFFETSKLLFGLGALIGLTDTFLVVWLQQKFLLSLYNIELEITPNNFQLRSSSTSENGKIFENSTELIKPILSFLGLPMDEQPITDPFLRDKLLDYRFHSRLNQAEKEWLASEIKSYLKNKNISNLTSLSAEKLADVNQPETASNGSATLHKSGEYLTIKISHKRLLNNKDNQVIVCFLLIWQYCLSTINFYALPSPFFLLSFLFWLLIRSYPIKIFACVALIGNILLLLQLHFGSIYQAILLIDTFVVLWIQRAFVRSVFAKVQLQINSKGFEIEWRRHDWYEEKFADSIKNLPEYLHLIGLPLNRKPLKIRDRIKHLYKNRLFLEKSEKEWLAKEITDFLQKVKK